MKVSDGHFGNDESFRFQESSIIMESFADVLTDNIEDAFRRGRLEHGCIPRHFASVMPCGAEIHVIQDDFPLGR